MKVAFYKGKKILFNKLTSWWLRGEYSHCELVLEELDKGSLCVSSSFMDGGVRLKVIKFDPSLWDIIDVDTDYDYINNWLIKNENTKYDTLGLFSFLARVFKQDKTRWFCSEAVADMLKFEDSWRFDPCNLYAALSRK